MGTVSNSNHGSATRPTFGNFLARARKALSLTAAAAVLTLSCFATPATRADAPPPPPPSNPAGYTEGHVYLYVPGGCSDVTNTVYVKNGQTYAVLNGQSIQIIPYYTEGHVYNNQGGKIGFIP